eukprot:COSAG06_NODE_226_length_19747_cov_9.234121_5_plen_45_part_00
MAHLAHLADLADLAAATLYLLLSSSSLEGPRERRHPGWQASGPC